MAAPECTERVVQKHYWLEHSSQPTVEAMMLDSKAAEIDQLERPEVLTTLGSVAGQRLLELGAGIGRFTGELAKTAQQVTACDFMEVSIAENRRQHEALGNVSFIVADVTEMQQEAGAYDVVFSNWLLMYLSDEEVKALAAKALRWLAPNGIMFFRESCFRPSGDKPRNGNPTHYRNPREYFAIFDNVEVSDPDGTSAHFELVCCKCVDTYVTVKKNQNQICWKFKKVVVSQPRAPLFRTFLDTQQYSDSSIAMYEAVFGPGFISPGGAVVSAELLSELQLRPSMRVLDVGCGIGGSAFLAADTYGCHVHGIDLSVNAIMLAVERAAAAALTGANSSSFSTGQGSSAGPAADSAGAAPAGGSSELPGSTASPSSPCKQQQLPHDVTFEVADVLTREFPAGSFDVCISRDSLLHIENKQQLFARLFQWLKPGGRLLLTDYCKAASLPVSADFQAYIDKHRYHLLSLDDYTRLVTEAGFQDVQLSNITGKLSTSLQEELEQLQHNAEGFRTSFGDAGYEDLKERWQGKLQRATTGEQLWVKVTATKRVA